LIDIKSFVGKRSETRCFTVTEERLKRFCESVGSPYRGEAPLTFLTVFRDGEFNLLAEIGMNLSQVLHGDQEFTYSAPIHAGDELEFDAALTKALEKKGATGVMRFLVFETDVRRKSGREAVSVGTMKTTVIVRGES
jgi:hypothetical protein